MPRLSDTDLRRARDLGAATYLSSYTHLMGRQLKIEGMEDDAINAMALEMVEPLNFATQAAWCAMMGDHQGMHNALRKQRLALEKLKP